MDTRPLLMTEERASNYSSVMIHDNPNAYLGFEKRDKSFGSSVVINYGHICFLQIKNKHAN